MSEGKLRLGFDWHYDLQWLEREGRRSESEGKMTWHTLQDGKGEGSVNIDALSALQTHSKYCLSAPLWRKLCWWDASMVFVKDRHFACSKFQNGLAFCARCIVFNWWKRFHFKYNITIGSKPCMMHFVRNLRLVEMIWLFHVLIHWFIINVDHVFDKSLCMTYQRHLWPIHWTYLRIVWLHTFYNLVQQWILEPG
jgi:hypothetical protein